MIKGNNSGEKISIQPIEGGVIDSRIANINLALNRTNELLADIGSYIFTPKTDNQCCGVAEPKLEYNTVSTSLQDVLERISGYNKCLEELRNIIHDQLGDNLKLQ